MSRQVYKYACTSHFSFGFSVNKKRYFSSRFFLSLSRRFSWVSFNHSSMANLGYILTWYQSPVHYDLSWWVSEFFNFLFNSSFLLLLRCVLLGWHLLYFFNPNSFFICSLLFKMAIDSPQSTAGTSHANNQFLGCNDPLYVHPSDTPCVLLVPQLLMWMKII